MTVAVTARWLLAAVYLKTLTISEHSPLGYRLAPWELKILSEVRRQSGVR